MKKQCSIGIMAYNEEANIGKLLQTLLQQQITCCQLQEIVVVASGCTDNTVPIAQDYAKREPTITVLVQQQREGKASAINLFLKHARSADIIVLESADTLPADEHTVNRLVLPLIEKTDVGMTGVRPFPVDMADHFLGFVVQLQWKLHHRISLISPKLGEMVAFKNILGEIPVDTAVDEACIEALIEPQGYVLEYVPDAVVYNKGPDTIRDFLKQRRRITAGHHHLRRTQHYAVSTLNPFRILASLFDEFVWSPKFLFWTIGAIALEVYGRFLGMSDFYIKKQNPFKWDMATTTKKVEEIGKQ
jgi:biofilm PGA synthesis N-glycosyltransferase PgaC